VIARLVGEYSAGNTISDVIGSPSASEPSSTGSRREKISIPSGKSFASSNQIGFGDHNGGFIGGGQIGYNWQFNNWLAGFETDIQGLSSNKGGNSGTVVVPSPAFPAFPLTETFNNQNRVDWLGTVRGRLGWLATPAFLIYGTGGLAYGGVKASTAINQMIAPPDPSIPASGFGGVSETRAGWTAGGGFEWMFAPNWSVKAEYLFFDLGSVSYDIPLAIVAIAAPTLATGSATAHISETFRGNIARAGINYHF
jgi:outer membrane immunogenic protein